MRPTHICRQPAPQPRRGRLRGGPQGERGAPSPQATQAPKVASPVLTKPICLAAHPLPTGTDSCAASAVLLEGLPHSQAAVYRGWEREGLFQAPEQEPSPPAQVLSAVEGTSVQHRLTARGETRTSTRLSNPRALSGPDQ